MQQVETYPSYSPALLEGYNRRIASRLGGTALMLGWSQRGCTLTDRLGIVNWWGGIIIIIGQLDLRRICGLIFDWRGAVPRRLWWARRRWHFRLGGGYHDALLWKVKNSPQPSSFGFFTYSAGKRWVPVAFWDGSQLLSRYLAGETEVGQKDGAGGADTPREVEPAKGKNRNRNKAPMRVGIQSS